MHFMHLALALLVVLVWGFNFAAMKIGLEQIAPLFLGTLRFFFTSIPWVFFLRFPATSFKKLLLYSGFMFAMQTTLLFIGMKLGASPGLASLLMQMQVFFSIAFGVLILKEKLHLLQFIGALVAFSGIVLIGINAGGSSSLAGILLLIGSAASWGFGNLISKTIGHVNMVSLVSWGSLMAWPPLFIASYFIAGPDLIVQSVKNLTWASFGSVLYISYLATTLAYCIWNWLLHHYRIQTVAPFTLLVPIIAIGSSVVIFDEELPAWKIWAGVLVIAGLCINLLGPRLCRKRG
jgi:O-acetylserine/cysteine efflux transporter